MIYFLHTKNKKQSLISGPDIVYLFINDKSMLHKLFKQGALSLILQFKTKFFRKKIQTASNSFIICTKRSNCLLTNQKLKELKAKSVKNTKWVM